MMQGQQITIDLQSYPTGIQLEWSRYDSNAEQALDFHYNVQTFTKEIIKSGGGYSIVLFTASTNYCGWKYIYIANTYISGNEQNYSTSLNTPIGTINNRNWVLRKVIAF